jgi:SAM-dependent methyltransferase
MTPLSVQLLWALDRLFPPNPAAYMVGDQLTARETRQAPESMGRYLAELQRTDVDVLDFGCGWGGETMWLAERVRSAVGVDVEAKSIEIANTALARRGIQNCQFACSVAGRLPFPDGSFDAVFSTDTFEHVMDLDLAFSEIFRVLKPGGSFVTRFGPLFYSPFGYHLYWACAVPYAHILFGLQPILALRNARCDSPAVASSWKEMGLNMRRFRDFHRSASRAGFQMTRFAALPVRNLHMLRKVPWLGDLFTFGVDVHVTKPGNAGS